MKIELCVDDLMRNKRYAGGDILHREQLIIWAKAQEKHYRKNDYKYPVFAAAVVVEFIKNVLLPKLKKMSNTSNKCIKQGPKRTHVKLIKQQHKTPLTCYDCNSRLNHKRCVGCVDHSRHNLVYERSIFHDRKNK